MSSKQKAGEEPSFETSVERLESLIDAMEDGDIALEDLVKKFEEGSKLLKQCQDQLKSAELKIQKLDTKTGRREIFGSSEDS